MPKMTIRQLEKQYTPVQIQLMKKRIQNYFQNMINDTETLKGELSILFFPQELRIINIMLAKEKAYVDEIATELELDNNNVAWALRILEYFGILRSRKERVGRVYKKVYKINLR
ncbi:hypothetical protein DRN50_04630 [Thermococci archaeon]|nr:MAG: hypothetical protein DRN50_04630 [Thermococci archaeon]